MQDGTGNQKKEREEAPGRTGGIAGRNAGAADSSNGVCRGGSHHHRRNRDAGRAGCGAGDKNVRGNGGRNGSGSIRADVCGDCGGDTARADRRTTGSIGYGNGHGDTASTGYGNGHGGTGGNSDGNAGRAAGNAGRDTDRNNGGHGSADRHGKP